jgi:hypothetical protein
LGARYPFTGPTTLYLFPPDITVQAIKVGFKNREGLEILSALGVQFQ